MFSWHSAKMIVYDDVYLSQSVNYKLQKSINYSNLGQLYESSF